MIGMIVVKKFSEMKKESEKLNYPKTLNFSYVDKDLELVTRDYITVSYTHLTLPTKA